MGFMLTDDWWIWYHSSLTWGTVGYLFPRNFSAPFPAVPSENHLNVLPYGTHPTLSQLHILILAAPCLWTVLFPFFSWLILTHLSNLDLHVSAPVKPSPSYPPCPHVSASRVQTSMDHLSYFFEIFQEKPGCHLVSHTRYTQYEHKQCFDSSEYV